MIEVLASLTMQKTIDDAVDTQSRTAILRVPEGTTRAQILTAMIDKVPEDVRSGVVVFFSAEPNQIGDAPVSDTDTVAEPEALRSFVAGLLGMIIQPDDIVTADQFREVLDLILKVREVRPRNLRKIGTIPAITEDHQKVFEERWRDLVMKGDQFDQDKVARELADYSWLMSAVSEVYGNATGGRISKPETMPRAVIQIINERISDLQRENTQAVLGEIADEVTGVFAASSEREAFLEILSQRMEDDPRA